MSDNVIAAVIARDGGCVGKGLLPGPCWGRLTGHHIVNRGMGGSKLHASKDWRLTMCEGHNAAMESDALTARLALAFGMKLPRNWKLPLCPRVYYVDGWHTLVGGTRIPESADV